MTDRTRFKLEAIFCFVDKEKMVPEVKGKKKISKVSGVLTSALVL